MSLNTLTVGQPLVGRSRTGKPWLVPRLNTLTVGQPLVGEHGCREAPWRSVSIPSQSGSLLSGRQCRDQVARRAWSQYPHSRAASCRAGAAPSDVLTQWVSIPSQSGSLLSASMFVIIAVAGCWSQYPHSRAASCRTPPEPKPLLTNWSQYPHSRAASCRMTLSYTLSDMISLNTLTVGQPLVGCNTCRAGHQTSRSQYPHSRAASCRPPHRPRSPLSANSLNTLTVGQPLVGLGLLQRHQLPFGCQ